MQLRNEIPDTFWGLFRSVNREIYIDALLYINKNTNIITISLPKKHASRFRRYERQEAVRA